jgi:sigma-E factor negative regulatory protein RseC
MGYRIGIVKTTEPGGYAQVMTERKNVCGECYHNKIVCYGCLLNPKVIGRVANPVGARVGDTVKIHISARKLYTAAGMFYLLPVFTLLLGILLGIYVSETLGVSETTTAIGCSFAGLAVGILFVTVLGRTTKISKMLEPVISSIVRPMDSGPG